MPNDERRKVLDALRTQESIPENLATPSLGKQVKPKTEITKLRATAKSLGISLFQKSKATLIEEIEAKEAA